MPRPTETPIGVELADAARVINRAFDEALAAAGGSRPTWLIMTSLKRRPGSSQQDVAADLGLHGATLTHHLGAMERDGLVDRQRDPANRRIQVVTLSVRGEELFWSLREIAVEFDARLRGGVSDAELRRLRTTLGRLRTNAFEPG